MEQGQIVTLYTAEDNNSSPNSIHCHGTSERHRASWSPPRLWFNVEGSNFVRVFHNLTDCGKFSQLWSWSGMTAIGFGPASVKQVCQEPSPNTMFGENNLIWKQQMARRQKQRRQTSVSQLTAESICCPPHTAHHLLSPACSLLH